jgi:hypothetical protein
MRFPLRAILSLILLSAPAAAPAGPWTEAPGDRFLAVSGGPDPDGPTGLRRDVHFAFGAAEGLTVGGGLTERRRIDGRGFRGRGEAFVRRRLWLGDDGSVASVQAGFGTGVGSADTPDATLRLLLGRGYATSWGDGWSEAGLGWRAEFAEGGERLIASLATGLKPAPGWLLMSGAEADLRADRSGRGWEVLRLTGTVAREAGRGLQVYLRAEAPVWGSRTAEGLDVRLGIWRAF